MEPVLLTRDGPIATVALNNPERLNALHFGVPINRLGLTMGYGELQGLLALAGRAVALEIQDSRASTPPIVGKASRLREAQAAFQWTLVRACEARSPAHSIVQC